MHREESRVDVLNNVFDHIMNPVENPLLCNPEELRKAIGAQFANVLEAISQSSDDLMLVIAKFYILLMVEAKSSSVRPVTLDVEGENKNVERERLNRLHSVGYGLAVDSFAKIIKQRLR
jgi:hypothetical protein